LAFPVFFLLVRLRQEKGAQGAPDILLEQKKGGHTGPPLQVFVYGFLAES
jgi:hypothetical protein